MAKKRTSTTTPAPSSRQTGRLIILFGIPVAILLIAFLLMSVSRWLARPQHDFVYRVCRNYLTYDCRLYRYDVKHDTSRKISQQEFAQYKINKQPKSADGYWISDAGRWQSASNKYEWRWYIRSGIIAKPLPALKDDRAPEDSSNSNYKIIGWID